MTISLSNNSARVSYSVSAGASQTSFTVPFEFFDADDLTFYVDGTAKTLTTHYTVSGGNGSTGTISTTAGNTVTGISGGSTVVITRDIDLDRVTDFPSSGPFAIATLNTELDRFTAIAADQKDEADRALRLQDFDSAVSMTLPLTDARKGTVLGFNATTGVPEAGPTIANVNSLAAITTNINTVAGISSNVTTVAGISSNVTTVAGISSNVTSVAGNASNINAVVSNASNINTVAGNISNVNAVAAKSSLITSDFVSDLNTVAVTDVINDLNTLATSDFVADLNLAATSDFVSDLNTMATSTNVNNLGTVAGAVSNVNTVAGIASNVSTVAGIASNVSTVAGDATDIGNVSGSIGNVNTVAGSISNVNSVAGNASNINSVAGNSSNINSAVSNASNINSAVSNASNINTVAGAITNVNNVAGSIANVNTVATNLSGVNSFASRYRVGSSDPTSSLDEGDLFYNTTSNAYKFYNGSSWNTVNVSGIGSLADDSSPQLGGNLDTNGNDISFGDNDKAIFGAGDDLQIYHDGSNSKIQETGTGDLFIDSSNALTLRQYSTNSVTAKFVGGGASELYYANSKKLETTATGVDVTGVITTDGMTTSADINFGDNDKAVFGAGSDLQIYHDGSNSVINEQGDGDLLIYANNLGLLSSSNSEYFLQAATNGAVSIRYDNSIKIATTNTGVDVTGVITTDGMTTSADINFGDNNKAIFGAGSDLEIYHDGSNSYVKDAGSGNLYIQGSTSVNIRSDAGENMGVFTKNGASTFYYDNAAKLATSSSGVTVTGTVTATAFSGDGSGLSNLPAGGTTIPSGTKMLFQQTAAPTGFTKDTTHNDKALRIVSGSVGTGGSAGFASALGTPSLSGSTGSTTLSIAQMPSHNHTIPFKTGGQSNGNNTVMGQQFTANNTLATGTNSTGGGGSHNHSMSGTATINVAYVDVIIATKD